MVFHAFIIINRSVIRKSLLFRKEEKLIALLGYSSIIKVMTSGSRIISYSLVVVFLLRNEEKPVAQLVDSSLNRVATSGLRIIPQPLIVDAGCAQMRCDSGITPYSLQHCSGFWL